MPSAANFSTRDLTRLSLLLALAIVLRLIENMFPVLFSLPGAHLGLANIMTIVVLVKYGTDKAGMFLLARILLVGLLSTGLGSSGFFIGLGGAASSFAFMSIFSERKLLSPIGLGLLGAAMHNCGQIAVAVHLMQNMAIANFLPMLISIGIPTGFFTGLCAKAILKRMD